MTNHDVVSSSLELLQAHPEWEKRFAKYATSIQKHEEMYQNKRKVFRAKLPFSSYTTISKAKRNTFEYDLRFKGQSLGTVNVTEKGIIFVPGKNYKYFEKCGINIESINTQGEDWTTSIAVKKYRTILKQNQSLLIPKFPEHECENKLLYEFKKKQSKYKSILHIQPICLSGNFFQMPTPLKASDHTNGLQYAGVKGGGIDILARVGRKRICVMEVKDGYENDTQEQAIQQAIAYATFLASLLRSASGQIWWNIFGFHGQLPKNIDIDVVSVMPINGADLHKDEDIQLPMHCVLHTRSLYFDKKCLLHRDQQSKETLQFLGTFLQK